MLVTRTMKKNIFLNSKFDPFKRSKLHRPPFKFSVAENFGVKTLVLQGSLFDTKPKQCTMNKRNHPPKNAIRLPCFIPPPPKKKVNLISLMTSWMFGTWVVSTPTVFPGFRLANQQQKTPKPISPPSLVHDCRCSVEILSVSKPPKPKKNSFGSRLVSP